MAGLILLIGLLAVDEFHRRVESHPIQRFYAAVGVVILWLMTVFHTYPLVLVFAAMYLPIMFMSLLDEIWNHSGKPLQVWGNMLISQVMIAFPLLTMQFMYMLDMHMLLALFIVVFIIENTSQYLRKKLS